MLPKFTSWEGRAVEIHHKRMAVCVCVCVCVCARVCLGLGPGEYIPVLCRNV